jgi:hypothetical protein
MTAKHNDDLDRRLESTRRTVIPSTPSSAIFPGWGVKF